MLGSRAVKEVESMRNKATGRLKGALSKYINAVKSLKVNTNNSKNNQAIKALLNSNDYKIGNQTLKTAMANAVANIVISSKRGLRLAKQLENAQKAKQPPPPGAGAAAAANLTRAADSIEILTQIITEITKTKTNQQPLLNAYIQMRLSGNIFSNRANNNRTKNTNKKYNKNIWIPLNADRLSAALKYNITTLTTTDVNKLVKYLKALSKRANTNTRKASINKKITNMAPRVKFVNVPVNGGNPMKAIIVKNTNAGPWKFYNNSLNKNYTINPAGNTVSKKNTGGPAGPPPPPPPPPSRTALWNETAREPPAKVKVNGKDLNRVVAAFVDYREGNSGGIKSGAGRYRYNGTQYVTPNRGITWYLANRNNSGGRAIINTKRPVVSF